MNYRDTGQLLEEQLQISSEKETIRYTSTRTTSELLRDITSHLIRAYRETCRILKELKTDWRCHTANNTHTALSVKIEYRQLKDSSIVPDYSDQEKKELKCQLLIAVNYESLSRRKQELFNLIKSLRADSEVSKSEAWLKDGVLDVFRFYSFGEIEIDNNEEEELLVEDDVF